MKRKYRILGVALVAVFAMSAIAAASASAFFDSEASPVTLKGVQTGSHTFTTSVGTIACTGAQFAGVAAGKEVSKGIFTTETVTVHPTYTGCTAFGFGANVKTEGCNYVFARTGVSGSEKLGTVTVECETGKKIVIEALGFCKMEVGPQGPLSTIRYKDEGTGTSRFLKVTAEAKNIVYSGTCGSGTNGEYKGVADVSGTDSSGNPVGVWVT